MSFLVELPRNQYPDDAQDAFTVTSQFGLENARAMMWLSQLAYETAHPGKIEDILRAWGLTRREIIDNPPATRLPLKTACAIVAGGRGATIVAFAGTDPLKINDWITDFNALPSADGIHTGFRAGLAAIWPRIAAAIANRPQTERALFFTGHSLGAALAIVAAAQALSDPQLQPTAIYTYGCPRAGDRQFADAYNPALGDITFRLVHGTDLVPTVPPSLLGFRHVGRAIQCSSGGRFDLQTPILPRDTDEPGFLASLFTSVGDELDALIAGKLFTPVGPGPLGQFIGILPRQIRDHLPPSYFAALAP
jgi:triacylglycerol lipase